MPYKFKVGAQVTVVKINDHTYELGVAAVGKPGKVIERSCGYYTVSVRGIRPTNADNGIGHVMCYVDELEAVPAKKTRKKRGK